MQRILYIYLFLAVPFFSLAQPIAGAWYGKADVDISGMHNNYLTELVIKQKGNKVEGIFGYYFRDKYQSFFIHGTYNPKTHEIIILNIPVIYYGSNSTVNSIDCNMNFRAVIINSKLGSSLKGNFYHDERYKYMCPDMKVSYALDKNDQSHDSVSAAMATSSRIWKPQADDFVVEAGKVQTDSPRAAVAALTVVTRDPAVATRDSGLAKRDPAVAVADTVKAVAAPDTMKAVVAAPPVDVVKEDKKKIAESFTKRKAVMGRVLDVESDSVRLSFYDNGEVDGDSISVFVNSQVVLTHQGLAARAFNLYLHLDSTQEVNEVSMFAENLGKYPPNTALMVVTDGKNRYEVFMSSSMTENATIQLRRKRKP